jgi:hypothetical protein
LSDWLSATVRTLSAFTDELKADEISAKSNNAIRKADSIVTSPFFALDRPRLQLPFYVRLQSHHQCGNDLQSVTQRLAHSRRGCNTSVKYCFLRTSIQK